MQIILSDFMSLDGVVQAPGGPDEDSDGGFAHGGWSMRYFDPEVMGSLVYELIDRTDALLFGRRTWEGMAAAWPGRAGDPYADRINAIPKYVASRTLSQDDLTWSGRSSRWDRSGARWCARPRFRARRSCCAGWPTCSTRAPASSAPRPTGGRSRESFRSTGRRGRLWPASTPTGTLGRLDKPTARAAVERPRGRTGRWRQGLAPRPRQVVPSRTVPRVRVTLPDELLQHVATTARELGRPIDDLSVEAIEGYVEAHQKATAGSMRSRAAVIPRGSPQLSIQIPEELYKRADTLAKRLNKRRDVLYSEALARYVLREAPDESAFDRGHDLPGGAWRPKGQGSA